MCAYSGRCGETQLRVTDIFEMERREATLASAMVVSAIVVVVLLAVDVFRRESLDEAAAVARLCNHLG
jgi:hypothetical protein